MNCLHDPETNGRSSTSPRLTTSRQAIPNRAGDGTPTAIESPAEADRGREQARRLQSLLRCASAPPQCTCRSDVSPRLTASRQAIPNRAGDGAPAPIESPAGADRSREQVLAGFIWPLLQLPSPLEQFVQLIEADLHPGRAAMVALPAAFGDFHLAQQGIHFVNRETAIGAYRAVTGHG
jgi:hypothetical protein